MSKENIVFKDSRQKETVDKHGFIIRKSKKSQNFGKESHIKLIENKKGTRNLANNLELSAERALAIKTYLISKSNLDKFLLFEI